MRLAYLITQYPKVSHTFIRREILALERLGHTVIRLAIRNSRQELVEKKDIDERAKTTYFLGGKNHSQAFTVMLEFVRQPFAVVREVYRAICAGIRSEIGFLRNLSYVIEALFFLAVLRKKQIDHVHAHFVSNSTAVARIMRRLGGPPYSFTAHGRVMFDSPQSLDVKGKVAEAAFVVGISDYTVSQLLRWARIDDWLKIHVVRCAVSESFFNRARSMLPASKQFVCVGRLSAEKGQLLLMQAFARVAADFGDATLTFVGDGPLRDTIQAASDRLGISKRVHLTGNLDESGVSKEIAQSRALIVPSFMEGLPVVIMESFALGRPVIATSISGIPELVFPGENGWLIPAGNIDRLEVAMREALTLPPETLEKMGHRGREVVKKRHDLCAEVAKLDGLFRRYSSDSA
ncbi:Glycosyltransferase [uncultured Woeseiaceae bacterium]|uniref:Glycosyltransferase n=1 Tax=uncultured Woeseiaceae bacterium TaxID=1983305 RepID=A0A7D9H4A1_9GAMM|nr:Glycosyltransferase [uncultured Woeseiaceae bacterium]